MNLSRQLRRIPAKLRNSETINYQQRILSNGGTISEASLDAVEKFVQDCKNMGIWPRLLEVCPFAGTNLSAALVKLIYPGGVPGVLTNVNFTAGDYNESGSSGGLNGDGATKYLNTGMNLQTYLPDQAHYSFYLRDDVAAAGNRSAMGALNGSDQYWLGALTPASGANTRLGGILTATLAQPFNKGFYIGSRLASNDLRLYKNGVLSGTETASVTHVKPNTSAYVFAFSSNGIPSAYLPGRGAFYSIGQGLTDAEATWLHNAVQTLQRNLGREI